MQWQSVNDDFQALPIGCRDPNKIQNVGRNTTARFTAYSCHHAFQSVTPFAQKPCPCKLRVMAKRVEWTATVRTHSWGKGHLQEREQLATGAGRLWSDDKWGKLATPTQRQGRRGTSPKLSLGQTFEGKSCVFRWARSTRDATPLRVATLVVRAQIPQAAWVEAVRRPIQLSTLVVRSPSHHQAIALWQRFLEARRFRMSLKLSQQLRCNVGMSGVDHWKAICPTRPVSCNSGTPSTAESQPSEIQMECGCVQLKDVPQALPQACIVRSGKLLHYGRSEGPQIMARLRRSTVDQKQPRTLEVTDGRNSIKQHLVFPSHASN